jgi:hypothetical protein
LTKFAATLDNINEIINDAVLEPHDNIEIAQANIGIQAYNAVAELG